MSTKSARSAAHVAVHAQVRLYCTHVRGAQVGGEAWVQLFLHTEMQTSFDLVTHEEKVCLSLIVQDDDI